MSKFVVNSARPYLQSKQGILRRYVRILRNICAGAGIFFENGTDAPAFVHTEQLSVSKLPIAAQYAQIRDKSLFFKKNARTLAYVQNLL